MVHLAFVFKASTFGLVAPRLNFTLIPTMFSSMQPFGGDLLSLLGKCGVVH